MGSLKIINAVELTVRQKEQVCDLWNEEYPSQLAIQPGQFDIYLQQPTQHHHFLIQDEKENIIGWAYVFDRDGDRWFSIIIDNRHQNKGYGRMLLDLLKAKESRLNGWVVDQSDYNRQDGDPYVSPISFYLKNGFIIRPDIRYEDGKLSAVKIEWIKS